MNLRRMCILLLLDCVLQMSVRSSQFILLFKSYIFWLIFGLVVPFIIESGILKCSTIITELFISPFSYDSYCFMYFCSIHIFKKIEVKLTHNCFRYFKTCQMHIIIGFCISIDYYTFLLKCEKVNCLVQFIHIPK